MADQPNITSLLAALAQRGAQNQAGPPGAQPQAGLPQGFPGNYHTPTPPAPLGGFALPQPSNSGSLDLSSIKPVSSGTVSIADAIAKARGIAAEKGVLSDGRGRGSPNRDDGRNRGYRRSPSRSPPRRRDQFRDNYNPYRDDRRGDRRDANRDFRDRSYSPGPRDRRGGSSYDTNRQGGRGERSPPSRGSGGGTGGGTSGEDVEMIQIDSTLVGLIIGRQGENLRRVEQETGCRVQFITGPDVSGPRRDCKITGPKRARDDAKAEIARIIEENGRQQGNSNLGQMPVKRSFPPPPSNPVIQSSRDEITDDTTQIMVPDRTVGLIIGRGGETIRDLQEKSGCHVNIVGEQKSVNGLRPVNLIGSPRNAQIAKDLIMEIVQSDNKNLADSGANRDQPRFNTNNLPPAAGGDRSTGTIIVPSSAVGMIIGKGGETIKEMQNQSGCKINVSPQSNPNETERSIGLIGTPDAIARAKALIEDKVEMVGAGTGRSGRNDSYNDSYSQNQRPYGHDQGQAPQAQGAIGAPADAADPYAPYGGYQAYVSLWTQAMAAQAQAQQQGGGQGESRPPGTS
ncbi:MAG: hypothetical protein M1814_001812 [Vezdaea aestivalis]|nr:MAG: hypothetical protein M1814_001812 [Vezdaea aestivalis]